MNQHSSTGQLVKELTRPSDFVDVAEQAGAEVDPGHGSRKVVRYRGRTIGFSDHGNREYPREYRYLLIRAFKAAGILLAVFALVTLALRLAIT